MFFFSFSGLCDKPRSSAYEVYCRYTIVGGRPQRGGKEEEETTLVTRFDPLGSYVQARSTKGQFFSFFPSLHPPLKSLVCVFMGERDD